MYIAAMFAAWMLAASSYAFAQQASDEALPDRLPLIQTTIVEYRWTFLVPEWVIEPSTVSARVYAPALHPQRIEFALLVVLVAENFVSHAPAAKILPSAIRFRRLTCASSDGFRRFCRRLFHGRLLRRLRRFGMRFWMRCFFRRAFRFCGRFRILFLRGTGHIWETPLVSRARAEAY